MHEKSRSADIQENCEHWYTRKSKNTTPNSFRTCHPCLMPASATLCRHWPIPPLEMQTSCTIALSHQVVASTGFRGRHTHPLTSCEQHAATIEQNNVPCAHELHNALIGAIHPDHTLVGHATEQHWPLFHISTGTAVESQYALDHTTYATEWCNHLLHPNVHADCHPDRSGLLLSECCASLNIRTQNVYSMAAYVQYLWAFGCHWGVCHSGDQRTS